MRLLNAMNQGCWVCSVAMLVACAGAPVPVDGRAPDLAADTATSSKSAETSRRPGGPSERIGSELLRADLAILKDAYTTLHPGLYRYRSREQIEEAFRVAAAEFDRDCSLSEAFLVFSRLTASFRCGHSFCNPANQSAAVRTAIIETGARVPFLFRWVSGKMIVTESLCPAMPGVGAIPRGAEVLAINGVSTAKIFASLMQFARADGANDAKRAASLEVDGTYELGAFDIYLPLLFPELADAETFMLDIRGLDGATGRVRVPVHSFADRRRLVKSRSIAPGPDAPKWTLTMPQPKIALLTMPDWVMYNTKWAWEDNLRQVFDRLANDRTPNLAIDLRANEGGSDVGHVILARLAERAVPLDTRQQIIRYDKVPERLNRYLDTWDDSFRDRRSDVKALGDGNFELKLESPDDAAILPVAPRYPGRVFVLIGPNCSSATFQFAQLVKNTGLATLVGRPTGGNQRGITGGNFFFVRLPHTGIEADLPLKTTPLRSDVPDAGIEPDILVLQTQADIASNRDADMDAVYAELGIKE